MIDLKDTINQLSDKYFESRPEGAKRSAIASLQSTSLESREILERKLEELENLEELLKTLKEEGVTVVGDIEEYEYGKFGWVLDNDGNKIELWEPIDTAFL